MELLERKAFLDDLDGLHRLTVSGQGRMLFLGGEAGVGKTSLIQEFASRIQHPENVLIGACEPLSTPRPHGLLADMDELLQGKIGQLLEKTASPVEIARTMLSELAHAPPTIMVIEDAHWIDDAAVDGLRYLGRRIGSSRLLAIVTYRDDEIGKNHPMRRLMGDLATAPAVSRMHLPPLSLAAVTQLSAGTALDPAELFRLTNGNPFFISEIIASGVESMPATVRDVVLARADRLSPGSRHVLETVAVIGSPAESWLVSEVSQSSPAFAGECIGQGLLTSNEWALSFRHELARNAVLEEIPAPVRIELHRRVLDALRESGSTDLARLVHHAAAAFDRAAVLEYGPLAAELATAFRSHREAAAQYERVMRYGDGLPPERRAELLLGWAYELYLMDQSDLAIAKSLEALEIWRSVGDPLREGDTLRWLSRVYWYAGRNAEADSSIAQALTLLESLPPGRELAKAYSTQSRLKMLAWDTCPAIEWGNKAIVLAEELGEVETLVNALSNVGAAVMMMPADQTRAQDLLQRALDIALRENMDEHVARAYILLASGWCEMYRFVDADPMLDEGIAFCADHDIDGFHHYLLAWRGLSQLAQGRWATAVEFERDVLRRTDLAPTTRIVALATLGLARVRQGDSGAEELLDEALELATTTGELQRLCPVVSARAERAWLAGDLDQVPVEVASIYELAIRSQHRWYVGQLAYWLWRAGALTVMPEDAFEPYALQIAGKWREATAAWRALGCPYEAAWALADSELESELRFAHAEFMRLGAAPAAAMAAHRLRELGVERIPRGPRAATQANPFQLTSRELEVLALLVQRQRTEDIAETLFLSQRTVSHHISAILAKLEVSTRHEAAWKAIQLGIVSQSGHSHLTK